jgi:8-oxo-dGTP pyrophosphatase MutT (NUDIX family)
MSDGQAMCLQIVAAALPYRERDGCVHVLFVRSNSGRWIIPKGHSEPGESTFQTAQREAWEEAGVRGEISEVPYAMFDHVRADGGQRVIVHTLRVLETLPAWPEKASRQQMWAPATALPSDINGELARIISDFLEEFCQKA